MQPLRDMRGKAIDERRKSLLMSPETGPSIKPLFDRGGRFVGRTFSLPLDPTSNAQIRGFWREKKNDSSSTVSS